MALGCGSVSAALGLDNEFDSIAATPLLFASGRRAVEGLRWRGLMAKRDIQIAGNPVEGSVNA